MPGTPIESTLLWLMPRIKFPLSSKNISLVEFIGAFSLKSIVLDSLSEFKKTIKPPPPIFPAEGSVTAKVKAVAIDASIAFPPFFRISNPT